MEDVIALIGMINVVFLSTGKEELNHISTIYIKNPIHCEDPFSILMFYRKTT